MPNRLIRGTIVDSESINACSDAAESFFFRLLIAADDFGRIDAHPMVLLASCYPRRIDSMPTDDVQSRLDELVRNGVVQIYEVRGRAFVQILRANPPRAKCSKYPGPEEGRVIAGRVQHDSRRSQGDITVNHDVNTVIQPAPSTSTKAIDRTGTGGSARARDPYLQGSRAIAAPVPTPSTPPSPPPPPTPSPREKSAPPSPPQPRGYACIDDAYEAVFTHGLRGTSRLQVDEWLDQGIAPERVVEAIEAIARVTVDGKGPSLPWPAIAWLVDNTPDGTPMRWGDRGRDAPGRGPGAARDAGLGVAGILAYADELERQESGDVAGEFRLAPKQQPYRRPRGSS